MNDISTLSALHAEDDPAELTLSLLIALSSHTLGASPLAGKMLGLVNLGGAAAEVARRAAAALEMTAQSFDAEPGAGVQGAVRQVAWADLLETSDYLVVGGEAKADLSPMISAGDFNRMKPGACLITIGEPENVDQLALINALWFETIGGAALALKSIPLVLRTQFGECPNAVIWPGLPVNDISVWYGQDTQTGTARPRLVA
ncbi:MAG: NAD(P)-dependent oxidoreductase [Pseudomonadota bacterium]